MLKKRLIACLLVKNDVIVQSVNFRHTNAIGNTITAIDFFNTWAIDEIVLLDVTREDKDRPRFYDIVRRISERCFVPLTVGGWVDSSEEVRNLLSLGADKVVLNTEAVRRPDFITEAAGVFGSQCIVVSIDAKYNGSFDEVYVDRGREATGLNVVSWAKRAAQSGAGEIFLTSIDRDGSRMGYDLQLLSNVSDAVDIPIIASGGVGSWDHLVDGIKEGRADAVAAANIFHFTEHSTKRAKEYMQSSHLNVRDIVFYRIQKNRNPQYQI